MHEFELIQSALPRYDITHELGRGACGVVLAGTHKALGRPVAIKQLPRAFGADPQVRERFVVEARLLASLDHPHIVQMFDFFEREGLCIIVMERLTGGTVWDRFIGSGITPQAACAVIAATCEGLHYAHEKGVLHRDIKPHNLMFSAEGVLKITDFGIAKVVAGARTMATQTGFVLGTPAYMSPEQARGKELSAATDIYAAGAVLYELLSGSLPFPELPTPLESLHQRMNDDPIPLRSVAPDIPPGVIGVVERSMARDPSDRFQDGREFAHAIAVAASDAWGADWAQVSGVILRSSGLQQPSPSVQMPEPASPTAATEVSAPPVATASSPAAPPPPPPPEVAAEMLADVDAALSTGAKATQATRRIDPAAVKAAMAVKPEDLLPAGEVLAPLAATPPRERSGRSRTIILAVVVILIIGGVVAAAVMSQGGGSPKRATAPTTVATTPAGDALSLAAATFDNDFSPGSGWFESDGVAASHKYQNGVYTLTMRQPNDLQVVDTSFTAGRNFGDISSLGDASIEMRAALTGGHGEIGIGCRGKPTAQTFDLAGITDAGQWSIDSIVNGLITEIAHGQSTAIPVGSEFKLRLDCYQTDGGTALSLWVNGNHLGSATDPAGLPPGTAAVYGATTNTALSARFNRFTVFPITKHG